MKKEQDVPDKLEWRSRAEKILAARPKDEQDFLHNTDLRKLTHELEVHQIELETQNDELRRSYQSLETARDKYSDLYDFAPVSYLTLDEKLLVIDVNFTCASLLGVDKRSLMKQGFSRYVARDYQDTFYLWIKQGCATKTPQACELKLIRKDGSEFYGQLECMAAQDAKGNAKHIRAAIMDVTERKRSEEEVLRISKAVDSSSDAIRMSDAQGRHFYQNKAFTALFEYTAEELESGGADTATYVDPAVARDVFKKVMSAGSWIGEVEMVSKSGRKFPVYLRADATKDDVGNIISLIEVYTDMSERKQLELETIQMEKTSALGTIVAGVAHELNNPMMGILHFAQYCIKHTDEDDKTYRVLKDIEHETERCIDIVKNLLAFSRTGKDSETTFERENISEVLDRVLGLLSYRIKASNISVTKHVAEGTPGVLVKVGNIHQVFLNVISNAIDALQDSQKKEIRIHARPEGEYLQVTVTDTGCGIDAEALQRIFDPFFTTKPVGNGTGLGLSVSLGIVEAHSGKLTCKSELGVGTTFEILIPTERKRRQEDEKAYISD
jgi:two-component system cell cycle sensor histidine kinase/response regulator CckA